MKTSVTQRRKGLTLIELIVVLVILVGLAGIIIPMLPSMITRTHGAAGATNIGEIAKWVQTYEALHYTYPDDWDAILKADGSEPELASGDHYFELGADTVLLPLTAGQAEALKKAGIKNLHHSKDAPDHATLNPYAALKTVPTPVAATVNVVGLSADGERKLNLDTDGQYVILGLGNRNSMIGKTVADAPVHFPDNAEDDPTRFYGRFGVVFKVGTLAPNQSVNRAIPVAVVAFHHDEITTLGDHVNEYFNAVNNK